MTLFFDLDGTLIDTSLRHHTVYSEIVSDFKGTPLAKNEYWGLKRQKQPWSKILPLSDIDASHESEFLQQFIAKIESTQYLDLDTLINGASKVLAASNYAHTCYLVSLRRNHSQLVSELQRLKIDHYFTEIVSGHSETDGFDKKIELIRPKINDASTTYIIGDTEADIITGQSLGLKTVAVLSGIRTEELLGGLHPDYMLQTIEQLQSINELLLKY